MRDIISGTHPKFPADEKNLNLIGKGANANKQLFVNLIMNLELFDLEERKQVRDVIVEVYLQRKEQIEPILAEFGDKILDDLLPKYGDKNLCHSIGPILRIYTSSPILVKYFCKIEHLNLLKAVLVKSNFTVQSEAIETLQVSAYIQLLVPFQLRIPSHGDLAMLRFHGKNDQRLFVVAKPHRRRVQEIH